MCARCLSCSVRSLSKIEFHAPRRSGQKDATEAQAPAASRKRGQRYANFPNRQNFSATFFRKKRKKDDMGQNGGELEEKWNKQTVQLLH